MDAWIAPMLSSSLVAFSHLSYIVPWHFGGARCSKATELEGDTLIVSCLALLDGDWTSKKGLWTGEGHHLQFSFRNWHQAWLLLLRQLQMPLLHPGRPPASPFRRCSGLYCKAPGMLSSPSYNLLAFGEEPDKLDETQIKTMAKLSEMITSWIRKKKNDFLYMPIYSERHVWKTSF